MLKARSTAGDGTPIMMIGLSAENVTNLTAGDPIVFNTSELGLPPCHVLITYGRTEEAILHGMREKGVTTRVHRTRRAGGA